MELYLVWLLIGLGLVIAELLSGTFYLLMLGVAAFGGAAAAYFGAEFPVQIMIAAAVAAAGCYAVHLFRARNAGQRMTALDAGQPASFERWLDESGGFARVRYRGASWDAHVDGDAADPLAPGALLYVVAAEGSTLKVSRQRPA